MSSTFDVVIVGAGMVGSAIACGLARSGLSVAIVDPQAPVGFIKNEAPHIRVSAVSYASEQILKNIGAWPFIEAKRLCPYRRLAVNEMPAKQGLSSLLPDISSWAQTEFSAEAIGQTHLGHIIENDIVHLALHETMHQLENISLFCPDRIESMDLSADHKRFILAEAGEIQSRLVIGADGANSRVRTAANLGQYKEKYEQHAFVCTVSYEGAQEDITGGIGGTGIRDMERPELLERPEIFESHESLEDVFEPAGDLGDLMDQDEMPNSDELPDQ